jgi:molybdopterin-guanine dinucleotide biosynthesis protein A
MVAAAILAGGRARRFGQRDKASLPIGDLRIIDRQLAALRPITDRVVVVTSRPAHYASLGVVTVVDLRPGTGALGGIYTAIVTSPAPQTLIVACDMPFLTAEFLAHLANRGRDVDLAVPRTARGYEPLCASYGRACAPLIRRRLDALRLKAADLVHADLRVRELGPDDLAAFDPDGLLFLNVNTPGDYAYALTEFDRQRRR